MTEARYPMEHEPDYARATSTEPTGGSACLQSTPQIARSQGIDSSAFVAAVSRLPMQHVPHIDGALVDKYLQGLQLLGFIQQRSEERRGGKEGVSKCRSRWLTDH